MNNSSSVEERFKTIQYYVKNLSSLKDDELSRFHSDLVDIAKVDGNYDVEQKNRIKQISKDLNIEFEE
jgi:hypothetical protein